MILAPLRQPVTAQAESRYSLTAALVDHGTVQIDPYREYLRADYALRDGHFYSDKAPGLSVLAVPVYALYRALGGTSAEEMTEAGYPGVWLAVLWSSMIPAALIAGVATHLLRARYGWLAAVTGFVTVAGTLLLGIGSELFGHILAGAAIGGAAVLALWPSGGRPSTVRLTAAGTLAGVAVATEYSLLWLAAGLTGWVAWQNRARVLAFLAGAVPIALGLMLYLWVAFGSPFTPSYRYANLGDHTEGVGGIRPPQLDTFMFVIGGDRGLLTVMPIVLVAVAATVWLVRNQDQVTPFAAYALFGFGTLFVLQIGWGNPTGGASPGPRYLAASLALLAPGIAEALRRWPLIAWPAAAWSVLIMWLAAHADPTVPVDHPNALSAWMEAIGDSDHRAWVPLWGRLLLTGGALALVGAAAALLRRKENAGRTLEPA